MALQDRQAQLEAELLQCQAAISRVYAAGESSSIGGDISSRRVSLAELTKRQAQIIRSLQRLTLGGRMIAVNVSNASTGGTMPNVADGGAV